MSDADTSSNQSFKVPTQKSARRMTPAEQLPAGQSHVETQARKLATHLHQRGIRSKHLETQHPNILKHHAMAARVQPTDETWALAHRLLRYNEEQQQ